MKHAVITMIEKALNRYIHLDPETVTRLKPLAGKIVTIHMRGMGEPVQIIFTRENIAVKNEALLKADTVVSGTPLTLLRMSLTSGDRKSFFGKEVSIEGDLEVGQAVIDLFDELDIDWEEQLSHVTGDVSAHQMGRFVRGIKNGLQRFSDVLLRNINEYSHEEAQCFPTLEALKDFYADVDSLRMDVDRMTVRVKALKERSLS